MAIETAVVTGTTPTSIGTKSFESAGFGTPQAALVFVSYANTTNNPVSHARIGIGATDGTRQWFTAVQSASGVGTTDSDRHHGTTAMAVLINAGASRVVGSFSAWATNGVTIDFTTVDSVACYITVVLIKGCTSAYCGTKQLGSAAGTTVISDPAFKPNLVFLSSIGASTLAFASHNIISFGAAHNNSVDAVTQGMVAYGSLDANGADLSYTTVRNDSCVGQLHNNAQTWKGSAQNFNSSGFSINTGTDSPGSDFISYLALDTGDTDGVNVSIIDSPITTGIHSVTTPGFTPQLAILGLAAGSTVNSVATLDPIGFGLSAFDGTAQTCAGVSHDDNAATTNIQSNYSASNAVELYEFGGTTHDLMFQGAFSAFDSSGYDINFPTHIDTTARKWLSIAIKGVVGGTTTIYPQGIHGISNGFTPQRAHRLNGELQ